MQGPSIYKEQFENICSLLIDKINMVTLTEAKLEGSFPINQVLIKRFHQLFWLDININIGVAII